MATIFSSSIFIAFAALLMTGALVSGQQCQGDLQGLMTQCAMYVQRPGPMLDPSTACCNVVSTVDIPCVCKFITASVEAVIAMDKVVHVAAACGKPLAHGMKCGSYTVP